MSKMEKFAAIFGQELNKPFRIKGREADYRFTDKGLEYKWQDTNAWTKSTAIILDDFFTGKVKIIEEPWKPKNEEIYYTVLCLTHVVGRPWYNNSETDEECYKHRNCFKTKEEAQEYEKEVIGRIENVLHYDESKKTVDTKKMLRIIKEYCSQQKKCDTCEFWNKKQCYCFFSDPPYTLQNI